MLSSRSSLASLIVLSEALALPVCAAQLSAEPVEWNRAPIAIALKVDAETQIQFPAPVKVGMPTGLRSELRAQSVDDTVYLKPSASFDATRLVVQSRDGRHTYLLDVSSSDTAEAPKALRVTDATALPAENDAPTSHEPMASVVGDPVALTRFAAQQLYAPSRLLPDAIGIVREPVSAVMVDLLRGGRVTARPVIAWRGGRLHVTAVKLVNTSPAAVELDPRELRGEWLTATFQHNRLLAAGDEADTTVVYLVSERPFVLSY